MIFIANRSLILLVSILAIVIAPVYASTQKPTSEKVKLRLLWKHQFQFAGYYMAHQKGFYANRGLDVEIIEYDPKVNNLDAVTSSETEFSVGRSSLLINRSNGHDIVALLAAFQHSPSILLTRAFTGIEKPADLYGKRIMLTPDSANSGEITAMLLKAGITQDNYISIAHTFNVDDLIKNKTDALSSYVSNEPYIMLQQGLPYNILHPADYGFDMYSDILYTSGKIIEQNPAMVESFYESTIEGWKYAFANIPETVSIIHKLYNSQNRTREALLYEAQELKKLAFDEQKNFGTLLPHRFRSMAQIYLLADTIDKTPELDGFIYKPPAGKLNLTYDELAYIKDKQVLNVCVQKDWLPYEKIGGNTYQGILSDFSHLIRDKTGLSIYPIPTDSSQQALTLTLQGICDMTSVATQKNKNSAVLLFSESYISIPLAYVSHDPINLDEPLKGRIAISSSSPYYNMILSHHKNFTFIEVDSEQKALNMLKQDKVDGVIGSQAHINALLVDTKINNLNLADYPLNLKTSFVMNQQHPVLHSIINKTIALFTAQDRDKIMSRWLTSTPNIGHSDQTYILLIALITLFSAFILYRYISALIRSKILKELSETDQLTGIANRRKTFEDIQRQIDLSNRYSLPLSIIYFDIDNFKLINDFYGHKTGDRVLIELSSIVKKQIRKTDFFGRWGGEEFILCSPESDLLAVKKMTSLLKEKISQYNFKLKQKVSCSFGITSYQYGESLDDLINRADKAMYEAKQKGKDCIIIFDPAKPDNLL